MKHPFSRSLFTGALAALALSTFTTAAADWPQWRGPNRTDIGSEKGLLKSWPEGGPKQLWTFKDAGLGYAGVSIVGGKLFTMGLRNDGEELIAIDAKDAKELWSAKIGTILKNDWGDGPRGTPAVDGAFVYALGGQGNLICAGIADGKIAWQKSMKDFGGKTPGWGYTESVLVDGDKVLCTPGGSQGAIIALNKKTGETIWQSKDFTDGAQYSSIMPAVLNGKRQYVQLTMKSIVGLHAANGNKLWSAEFPGRVAVIPTPIISGNQVYVTAGYGVGCMSVKINPDNSVTGLYTNKVMKNHHGGAILIDGHVYGHSDGSGWMCQNFATGEEVWMEKNAFGKGAVAYADGMLYCLSEGSGNVALVEASPKGWKLAGSFKLDPQTTQRKPQGRVWTHPVVLNGRLYLRDQELLSCYDVKGK